MHFSFGDMFCEVLSEDNSIFSRVPIKKVDIFHWKLQSTFTDMSFVVLNIEKLLSKNPRNVTIFEKGIFFWGGGGWLRLYKIMRHCNPTLITS